MRLRRLDDELGDAVEIEWRSFLLRPHADPTRTLEKFRAYTQSWLRPAAEADAPRFQPWVGDAGPPSHSVPPHLVAKAAASLGREAFDAVHERLLKAYFEQSRDITSSAVLREIWLEAGLPEMGLLRADDPALLREVATQHNAAVERDVNGVPAVAMAGVDVPMVGAMPYETYRRWVEKRLAGEI